MINNFNKIGTIFKKPVLLYMLLIVGSVLGNSQNYILKFKKSLEQKIAYTPIFRVENLSDIFLKKAALAVGENFFLIENPGEKFNVTDDFDEQYLNRRLVFAGENKNYLFLVYEQGGYTLDNRLLTFDKKKNKILIGVVFTNKITSLHQLLTAISKKEFRSFL